MILQRVGVWDRYSFGVGDPQGATPMFKMEFISIVCAKVKTVHMHHVGYDALRVPLY